MMIVSSQEGLRGNGLFSVGAVTWTDLDSMLLGHHWTRGILAGAGTGEGNDALERGPL